MNDQHPHSQRRRALLKATGSLALVSLLPTPAAATPERMQQAMTDAYGDRPIQSGRVKLQVPPLAENGNSVAVTVTVESAMRGADRVERLTLFAAANPLPVVTHLEFGPSAARAQAAFRIRLADTQRLLAVAEFADGSLWSGSATTIVTLAACTDFLI